MNDLSKVSRIRSDRSARFANDAEDPGVDGALTGLWPEILLDLCAIANALTDSDSCSKIGRDPSTPVPLSCRKTGDALLWFNGRHAVVAQERVGDFTSRWIDRLIRFVTDRTVAEGPPKTRVFR